MEVIDRRSVLTGILCGAAIATVGLTVIPKAAKSLPLGAIKAGAVKPQDLTCIRAGATAVAIGAAGGTGDGACVAGAGNQPVAHP
jgi:hypothetical protein